MASNRLSLVLEDIHHSMEEDNLSDKESHLQKGLLYTSFPAKQ